jgi:digeranylgeranylglycerophospholipid reductase
LRAAIVGGGPAGLMAATRLAESGQAPVVFERQEAVGVPVRCGEALIDPYGIYEADPPGSRVSVKELHLNIRRLHVFPVRRVNIWVLDKDTWLQQMAAHARSLGAEIRMGTVAQLSDLKKDFDYVLDCSGCPSQAQKEYGIHYGKIGLGIQFRAKGDFSRIVGRIEFHFVQNEVGYRWVFPKSRTHANVGMGWVLNPPRRKWDILRKFVQERVGDFTVEGRTAGNIPMEMPPRLCMENVLLCGDAAGLANPYHGGGIHNALISGRIAADCLLKGKPELYQSRLSRVVMGEKQVAAFARSLLEGSFGFHDRMVGHLAHHYLLGEIFTERTHRQLTPFIQIWRLRSVIGSMLGI